MRCAALTICTLLIAPSAWATCWVPAHVQEPTWRHEILVGQKEINIRDSDICDVARVDSTDAGTVTTGNPCWNEPSDGRAYIQIFESAENRTATIVYRDEPPTLYRLCPWVTEREH